MKSNFKIYDNAIIRIPRYSIDDYKSENTPKSLLEVIYVSSNSLYSSLINNPTKESTISSQKAYFMRASTRTTPFGLAAGVFKAHKVKKPISNQNLLYKKLIRVDMEWLVAIVKMCEKLIGDPLIIKTDLSVKDKGFLYVIDWNNCYMDIKDLNSKMQINKTAL